LGWKDASRPRIHLALKLEARKIKFIYPRSKQGNFGETTDMLPFYAYLNRLFRRTVTPREGDGTKILAYNKSILAAMAPQCKWIRVLHFWLHMGRNNDYLREPTQELWICSVSHAYDRESDSSDILLRKGTSPLADQEWFESSSGGVKSSGTTFFTS
jgi:hypothetical protein